jgi:hypothetical protein
MESKIHSPEDGAFTTLQLSNFLPKESLTAGTGMFLSEKTAAAFPSKLPLSDAAFFAHTSVSR